MQLGPKIAMARQALDAVLSQLRAGPGRGGAVHVRFSTPRAGVFTRDLAALQGALSEFEPFGTTSLYDATAETARSVAARSATHKAIIVLTDGIDTSSAMSAPGCRRSRADRRAGVRRRDRVTVDQRATLGRGGPRVGIGRSARTWQSGRAGGCCSPATFPEAVVAASSIIDEIRQQYLLAIEASDGQGVAKARCARETPLGRREGAQRIFRRLMRRTRIRSVCRVWTQKTPAAPRRGSSSG